MAWSLASPLEREILPLDAPEAQPVSDVAVAQFGKFQQVRDIYLQSKANEAAERALALGTKAGKGSPEPAAATAHPHSSSVVRRNMLLSQARCTMGCGACLHAAEPCYGQ